MIVEVKLADVEVLVRVVAGAAALKSENGRSAAKNTAIRQTTVKNDGEQMIDEYTNLLSLDV